MFLSHVTSSFILHMRQQVADIGRCATSRNDTKAHHVFCRARYLALQLNQNFGPPAHVARHTDHHKLCTVPPASLLDELNYFYARVDQGNKEVTIKVDLPPGELPLSLSTSDTG